MNKHSTDTLILFIFTINVLSLVFLGDNSPILGLLNKLISIAGLAWLVNYFYKTLKFKNSSEGIDLNQHKDKYKPNRKMGRFQPFVLPARNSGEEC